MKLALVLYAARVLAAKPRLVLEPRLLAPLGLVVGVAERTSAMTLPSCQINRRSPHQSAQIARDSSRPSTGESCRPSRGAEARDHEAVTSAEQPARRAAAVPPARATTV